MDIRIEDIELIGYVKTLNELNLNKEELEELRESHPEELRDYLITKKVFNVKENHVVYNDDGSFSHLFIDKEINLKKYENTDLKKMMKNELIKYINTNYTIIESGQKVNIDKKAVQEYSYSKKTDSLYFKNKVKKYLVIDGLNLIIENSKRYKWSKNNKKKHDKDAAYGFYVYKCSFIFKNSSKLQTATLLIRNSKDFGKYLYYLFIN